MSLAQYKIPRMHYSSQVNGELIDLSCDIDEERTDLEPVNYLCDKEIQKKKFCCWTFKECLLN